MATARRRLAGQRRRAPSQLGDLDLSRLGVVVASVVAALAAVGIAGPLLVRMVRNSPAVMALVIVAALVVGATFLWWELETPRSRWLIAAGTALCAVAVFFGAVSQGEREHPEVSIALEDDAQTMTIRATGSSLRSREHLGVDVRAVRLAGLLAHAGVTVPDAGSQLPFVSLHQACREPVVYIGYPAPIARDPSIPVGTPFEELSEAQQRRVRATHLAPATPVDMRQLAWTETGPEPDGRADTELQVIVPAGYDLVCVRAMLRVRAPWGCGQKVIERLCEWTNLIAREHQSHGEMLIPATNQRQVPQAALQTQSGGLPGG